MNTVVPIQYLDIFGAGQLLRPCGITTDESMNIYVAQGPVGRIAKFDQHGKLLMTWGQGEGGWLKKVGKLLAPTGVAVDPVGNIYVADAKLDCIHKFDASGRFVIKFGQRGTADGEFDRCRSVHLDSKGYLWAVDARNNRIQKFDAEGNLLFKLGGYRIDKSRGGQGQFENPGDLAFDQQGCIYVTDGGNFRVQKFDPEGNFLLMFGKRGTGDGEFLYPRGIALDSEQRVYVVDAWANLILVFDTEGHFMFSFGGPKKLGGPLKEPYGITINKQGSILVTDNANDRIMVFSKS